MVVIRDVVGALIVLRVVFMGGRRLFTSHNKF